MDALEREFEAEDISKIKQIVISERLPTDIQYWWPTKDGIYTTKSGYWLGCFGHLRSSNTPRNDEEEEIWNVIWNINGPPKLQHFAWRATAEAMAVKENLTKRHIITDPVCPICSAQSESIIHALFECDYASQAWMSSPFIGTLLEAPVSCFRDQLLWCKKKMKNDDLTAFLSTAWAVWRARNQWLFQQVQPRIHDLVHGFLKLIGDYKAHSSNKSMRLPSSDVTSNSEWMPPTAGTIKINTDAGFPSANTVGLGMIAKDEKGKPLVAAVKRMNATLTPAMTEALAFLWGLKIAKRFKFSCVILESDALELIKTLSGPRLFLAPIGVVLDDIRSLFSNFLSVKCNHVRRVGNTAAHFVARLLPQSGLEQTFVESFPQGLCALLSL